MVISLASMALRLRSVTSWQTSRSESGATVMGERRTWSPCRGRRRWARMVAAEPSPGRASRTRTRPDARTIGPGCPASSRAGQPETDRWGAASVRSARGSRVRRQAALCRQVADRLPGELRRLGVRVLPPVHGRDGDRDLVRELLLRHAELLAESADQVARIVWHAGPTEQPTCHAQRRPPARLDAALARARRQKEGTCGEIAPRALRKATAPRYGGRHDLRPRGARGPGRQDGGVRRRGAPRVAAAGRGRGPDAAPLVLAAHARHRAELPGRIDHRRPRLGDVGRAGGRPAPACLAAARVGPPPRGDCEGPPSGGLVALPGGRPRSRTRRRRDRQPVALPARHRLALPRQARRVRRGAGLDLLPADPWRAHDLGRGVLDRCAGDRPPPRGRPAPEDRGLEPVLAPAHSGRAARPPRRLDGGRAALPRSLGVEAAPLRPLVAAAVAAAYVAGWGTRRTSRERGLPAERL